MVLVIDEADENMDTGGCYTGPRTIVDECKVWLCSVVLNSLFSEQMPCAFHSVPGVFYPGSCLRSSNVLGAALPPRLDFSIIDTFAYSRVPSEHSPSPRFGSHVFRGGAPTLPSQARLPRETISLCWGASPPGEAVGRLALSASTSSRINRCH